MPEDNQQPGGGYKGGGCKGGGYKGQGKGFRSMMEQVKEGREKSKFFALVERAETENENEKIKS